MDLRAGIGWLQVLAVFDGILVVWLFYASIVMRLLALNLFNKSTGRGSPGVSKLRWKHPVFAGDILSAHAEILGTKALRSKPGLGLVFIRIRAANQNGKDVIDWENPVLFERREPAR